MIPDLIGYKLDEALKILKQKGWSNIMVTVTAPPKEKIKEPSKNARVLKMIERGDKVIEIISSK